MTVYNFSMFFKGNNIFSGRKDVCLTSLFSFSSYEKSQCLEEHWFQQNTKEDIIKKKAEPFNRLYIC